MNSCSIPVMKSTRDVTLILTLTILFATTILAEMGRPTFSVRGSYRYVVINLERSCP